MLSLQRATGQPPARGDGPALTLPSGTGAPGPHRAAPPPPPPMPRQPARPVRLDDQSDQSLATCLGAACVAPGLLLREQAVPAGYCHGGVRLDGLHTLDPSAFGMPTPAAAQGWWFMDTETTGLAGGTGTLVFLYGGIRSDGRHLILRQWLLSRLAGEPALIRAVTGSLADSGLLVTYNGKSFDLPLLRTRARLHGEAHLPTPVHLDLLHPARSAYGARWPNVRLQTAEQRLCAFQRDDDLPGSEAPQAFMDWLRLGHTGALRRVLDHHRHDVLSLAALTICLAKAYRNPEHHDADPAGILRRLRRQGLRVRAGQAQFVFSN